MNKHYFLTCFYIISFVLSVSIGCVPRSEVLYPDTDANTETPTAFITGTPEPQQVQLTPQTTEVQTQVPTPIPTPSPTPTPSPSPSPTPSPTPSPEPTQNPAIALLQLNSENVGAYTIRGSAVLYASPSTDSESERVFLYGTNPEGTTLFQIAPSVETDEGVFVPVYFPRSKHTGYVRESSVVPSSTMGGEHSYTGFISRQNVIIWSSPHLGYAKVVAREGYEACRVYGLAGSNDMFAYVLTEKGTYGYVYTSTIMPASSGELISVMNQPVIPEDLEFDIQRVIASAVEKQGIHADDDGIFLYQMLRDAGLSFNPYYYELYQKPFGDSALYSSGLYTSDVYNSMRFKLFNTSGWTVTFQGRQTQWLYIDSSDQLEPGDLVFFTGTPDSNANIDEEFRVIFRGRYSGYITRCGIYLGDNTILTVKDRTVTLVTNAFSSESNQRFDSGRRILSSVQDYRQFVIESMISLIYDRLGTPYDNFQRLGDTSYDCSGIVCWALGSMGFKLNDYFTLYMDMDKGETTAAGLSNRDFLYYVPLEKKIMLDPLSPQPENPEDLEHLERGDLIFLENGKHSRVGHVMIYLGNNTVIHSTTVTRSFRGTLIAEIRPELQKLYCMTRRFGDF